MRKLARQIGLAGLLSALLVGGGAAGLLSLARNRQWSVEELLIPGFLLLGTVGLFSSLLTRWLLARSTQIEIHQLASQIAAVRANPTQSRIETTRTQFRHLHLDSLEAELTQLANSYRKALAEIVNLYEQSDKPQKHIKGIPAQPHPMMATHFVVGSSRHRMVARLAPNLNITMISQPLRQILGRSVQELIAHSLLEFIHPEDSPSIERVLREALRDGESHNSIFRVLHPDTSEESFLQMDVLTCYDEATTPVHLRCHFTDVTKRILAERELRQTNENLNRLKESYRDLYHHAPVIYFSLDGEGKFVAFNETMIRKLGYPREALLGIPYITFLTPEGRTRFQNDPTIFERDCDIETQWVKQDGTIIDVRIATTTIHFNGEFVRSRSAALDITETKRLEADLLQKAALLQRANEQLKRTNQELEEFTYVVSHDLKEPLRTIEAFSSFLADDYGPQLEGEGQDYISHLQQASRRLGLLIDDLLTLSRTGRIINTPRPFAWEPVIETILCDLHDLIHRKGAKVQVKEHLPRVTGDPERLMQLLTNLISNALKYNRSEIPQVVIGAVEAAEEKAPQGFVTLYVRDNGIGIEPRYHEQIFRIFRRLHHRDEIEGTGAGLAICKRIVEAHGGRIWIESIPGNGSCFLFTLPRQQEVSFERPGIIKRNETRYDPTTTLAGR